MAEVVKEVRSRELTALGVQASTSVTFVFYSNGVMLLLPSSVSPLTAAKQYEELHRCHMEEIVAGTFSGTDRSEVVFTKIDDHHLDKHPELSEENLEASLVSWWVDYSNACFG